MCRTKIVTYVKGTLLDKKTFCYHLYSYSGHGCGDSTDRSPVRLHGNLPESQPCQAATATASSTPEGAPSSAEVDRPSDRRWHKASAVPRCWTKALWTTGLHHGWRQAGQDALSSHLQRLLFPGKIWFLFEHFGGSLQELFGFNLFFNFQRLPTVFLIIATIHRVCPAGSTSWWVPSWRTAIRRSILSFMGFQMRNFAKATAKFSKCSRQGGQINAAAPTGKRTPIAAALGGGSLALSDTTGKPQRWQGIPEMTDKHN